MADRHTFLRGLAALPLIGGSVALVGQPTAAAVPVTPKMLDAYNQWLFYERRMLLVEQFGIKGAKDAEGFIPMTGAVSNFHFPTPGPHWCEAPEPSTRAAVILSAAGLSLEQIGRGRTP